MLVVAFHLFDVFILGTSFSGLMLFIIKFVLYLFLLLMANKLIDGKFLGGEHFRTFLAISLVAFFLPLIFYLLGKLFWGVFSPDSAIYKNLETVFFFIPVWLFGIKFTDIMPEDEESTWVSILDWYFWIFIILFAVFPLVSLLLNLYAQASDGSVQPFSEVGGINGYQAMQNAWKLIKEIFERFWDSVVLAFTVTQNRVDEQINKTFSAYEGDIEFARNGNQGVQIVEFVPLFSERQQYMIKSVPFEYMALLKVWTFEGETFRTSIDVSTSCIAKRTDKAGVFVQGAIADDEKDFTVNEFEQRYIRCSFPQGLEAGSWRIEFRASYNFNTWSYITYSFVSQDTFREFAMGGQNINSILSIPREAEAIYTKGPVEVGLPVRVPLPIVYTPQPAGIAPASSTHRIGVFGLNVKNNMAGGFVGVLDNVLYLELGLPQGFSLSNCDRIPRIPAGSGTRKGAIEDKQHPVPVRVVEDGLVKFYGFYAGDQDNNQVFDQVTCDLDIDATQQLQFLNNQKVDVTFLGKADYLYSLVKTDSMVVR